MGSLKWSRDAFLCIELPLLKNDYYRYRYNSILIEYLVYNGTIVAIYANKWKSFFIVIFVQKIMKGISCSKEKTNKVTKGSTMDAFFCLINTITIFQVLYLTLDCRFKEQSMALDKIKAT